MPLLRPRRPRRTPNSSSSKSKGKGVPPPSIVRTPIPEGPGPFALFIDHAGNVARAVPALGAKLASIPGLLDQSAAGGRGTSTFLLLLGLVVVAALAAEAVLRAFMARFRHRLAGNAVPEQGLRSLMNLGGAGGARRARCHRRLADLQCRHRRLVHRRDRPGQARRRHPRRHLLLASLCAAVPDHPAAGVAAGQALRRRRPRCARHVRPYRAGDAADHRGPHPGPGAGGHPHAGRRPRRLSGDRHRDLRLDLRLAG